MRILEITVPLENLEDIKESLYNKGIEDMMVSGIINEPKNNKGPMKNKNLLNMFKIEVLVDDNMIDKIKYSLRKAVQLNNIKVKVC